MAECLEVLCEASLEEQQEEVTVLQSIFQDDFQIIQGGDGHAKMSFNLTVKVNIPYDVIDFEAFIPVEVFEDLPRRASSSGSDSGSELGNDRNENQQDEASRGILFNENHLDAEEVGLEASNSALGDEDHTLPESSPGSFQKRTKPGFTRSVSLQHWHVKADIRYLSPIYLTCTFPTLYPTESPPEFSLACLWLTRSQLQQLQEKLMHLWAETPNLPIVFTWADWLQNYAYEHLDLGSHLVLKESEPREAMPPPHAGADHQGLAQSDRFNTKLETALLTIFEYDLEMQRQAFRQGTHLCEICFDERDGTEFHYLDECRHFFCTECLKAHCDLHVDGGTVLNLLCPSHDCKTTIPPEILQEVLHAEKLERWERLLLSKTLDVMGDIVYCPRCNVAVVVDEDESLRLGHCANCFFAFCTECYEPWHHRQPCFGEDSDSDEEENGKNARKVKSKKTKGNKDEEALGGRASAISLRRQQRLQRERERKIEMSNLSFIRMMKKQGSYQYCPKCRMAVERISGCDMMHCSQCGASFCWRCGNKISGYDHFGKCGTIDPRHRIPVREPTLGETLMEQYRKANPKGKLRTKLCPRCHQKCLKENSNNNHLKCWACKTPFCYQCGKEIKGAVTMHFTAASSCTQHSDD